MRSPGAPSLRREVERQFWKQIATGITSEKAAEAVGVSQPVGTRWFRHRGGMPLFMSKPVSARYLSFAEREEIALLRAQDVGVANALKKTVTTLPAQLRQSLTWDRGKELSDHARFTIESGVRVFLADPHSPWQRGTKENTNGLLRQYFPKGTDLSRWSEQEIQAVARTLNNRPRKTLGWKTPAETLNEYIKSVRQLGVATTG
ncbi:Integrase core domain protein [compost metagenome]